MPLVGTIASLCRYPVKSMGGEKADELFVGYAGVYGDRLFGFASSQNAPGFPYLTGRDLPQLLLYRPRFRYSTKARQPPNWEQAQKLSPNINPITASAADLMIDVETPGGETFAIDDPRLLERLRAHLPSVPELTLLRSDKAMTDCRPISLFSLQTAKQLSAEAGVTNEPGRFRANIYLNLVGGKGFAEDALVGRQLRLGPQASVSILGRDGRCMMINLHPDTAAKEPAMLKAVAQLHANKAGIYAATLLEGVVRVGDTVELVE